MSRSIFPQLRTWLQDTWDLLLRAVTHNSQPEGSNLFSGREPQPETWSYWLSSPPLQTCLQTPPVCTGDHGLMKPAAPHHLQKAETQSWGPHTHQHQRCTKCLNTEPPQKPSRIICFDSWQVSLDCGAPRPGIEMCMNPCPRPARWLAVHIHGFTDLTAICSNYRAAVDM